MKRLLIFFVVLSIAVACTPTATPPAGSASAAVVEKPAINETTRGEIQALLQKQNRAMANKDQTAFGTTLDQERRTLVRCANESYDIATRLGVGAAPQVGKIEPYLDTYVRAWVQEGSIGQRRTFFRKVDGKWVQTEPTEQELGGEKKLTVQDVQIEYWGADQDVIDGFSKASLASEQLVLANLLSDNRRDALIVRFYPTRAVAGIQACVTVGYHLQNLATDPAIRMLRYWFNANGDLSPLTVSFISHEWLHWAQDQFIPGIGARLPWWLSEGWPEYTGQVARQLACRTWPTLKVLEDNADPNGPPEVGAQLYGFAGTMIEYLYATYGGKAAYSKLLLGFKEDHVPANVFPKVLSVSSLKFYDDWTAWAKKKYC